MVQGNERLQNAVRQVVEIGDPIVLVGAAGSGKSTVIESLALNEDVQNILAMREGGSIPQANVIVTDSSEIPEDCLIVTVELHKVANVNLFDDNVWLGKLIYLALKKARAGDEEDYRKNLEEQLDWELEHPVSGTLACHLQKIEKGDRAELLDAIGRLPFEKISLLYKEALKKSGSSHENVDLIFSRLLSKPSAWYEDIKAFWKIVDALDDKRYGSLKAKLEGRGLKLQHFPDKFMIVFNKDTMKDSTMTEIANTLLTPAYSEECLLGDVTLIFRGRKSLFEVDGIGYFTVSEEEDGEEVHCLRFIDTKGLLSETEATVDDEVSRIEDTLMDYFGNKIVFVLNADYSSFARDTDNALCRFLEDVNRELDVYFLYTHLDMHLIHGYTHANRFIPYKEEVGWSGIYETVKGSLDGRTKLFKDAISANCSKRKPVVKSSYHAACIGEIAAMNTMLKDNNVSYFEALDRMVADIASAAEDEMEDFDQEWASDMSLF